jgi:hypothetical protein
LILLDEASYASPDMVFEVIFPLLEVENAVFVGISTVLDEFNFFSKLLMLKDDDGDDFFLVVMIDTVCDDCKKLPPEEHEKCDHIDDTVLPPWKSKVKYARSKKLGECDAKKGRNARESMGLIAGDYNHALDTKYIKQVMDPATRKYYKPTRKPDRIFIAADPDGGGKSRMSVISGFICSTEEDVLPGTVVITSIDCKHCKVDIEQDALVDDVISRLRLNPLYETIPFILIPENMSGYFHSRIERHFYGYRNLRTFHEYNEEKAGVMKDATKSKDYVIVMNDKMRGGTVRFATDWFSVGEKLAPGGREYFAGELRMELLRYCYDEKGKLTGKINGAQDDLCVCFGMLLYFGMVITTHKMYANYRIASI